MFDLHEVDGFGNALGLIPVDGSGRPVATAQKPQLRVQIFPRIIKVAVPSPQHSPILGQLPLSQMVWSLCVSTRPRTCL